MADPSVQEAVRLARSGERDRARSLLLQVVERDEQNEKAWIWLAELVDDLEDKIVALENVLTINPGNEPVRRYLGRLQAQRTAPVVEEAPVSGMDEEEQGARLPEETRDPEIVVDKHGETGALQEVGAEPAVAEEPDAPPAPPLDLAFDEALMDPDVDLLALGRHFESARELGKAALAYEAATAREGTLRRRGIAGQRLAAVRRQQEVDKPIPVHTTLTWLRLSAGPVVLYLLLIFIQAAYRPQAIRPVFLLGAVSVVAGSLLTVGVLVSGRHKLWKLVLGNDDGVSTMERYILGTLGMILLAAPYVLLVIVAVSRLLTTRYIAPFP